MDVNGSIVETFWHSCGPPQINRVPCQTLAQSASRTSSVGRLLININKTTTLAHRPGVVLASTSCLAHVLLTIWPVLSPKKRMDEVHKQIKSKVNVNSLIICPLLHPMFRFITCLHFWNPETNTEHHWTLNGVQALGSVRRLEKIALALYK